MQLVEYIWNTGGRTLQEVLLESERVGLARFQLSGILESFPYVGNKSAFLLEYVDEKDEDKPESIILFLVDNESTPPSDLDT
jgi:hypothetical protein